MLTIVVGLSCSRALRLNEDSYFYLDAAQNLVDGHGYRTFLLTVWSGPVPDPALFWPPAYPILLSVALAFGLNAIHSARVVSLLAGIVAVLTFHRLARRLVNDWSFPLASLWLLLLAQSEIHWSVMSDMLFLAFQGLFLAVAVESFGDKPVIHAAGAGITAGLLCLTRHIGLAAPVSYLLALSFAPVGNGNRWQRARMFVLFVLGCALVYCPYLLYNFANLGVLLPNTRKIPFVSPIDNSYRVFRSVTQDLLPALIAFSLPLFCLGWRGIALSPRQTITRRFSPLALVYITLYVCLLVGTASTTYVSIYSRTCFPLYPLILLLGAHVLFSSWQLRRTDLSYSAPVATVVIVAGFLMAGTQMLLRESRTKGALQSDPLTVITRSLRRQVGSGDLVVAPSLQHVRFETGAAVLTGTFSAQELAGFLRRHANTFYRIVAVEDRCTPIRILDAVMPFAPAKVAEDGCYTTYLLEGIGNWRPR